MSAFPAAAASAFGRRNPNDAGATFSRGPSAGGGFGAAAAAAFGKPQQPQRVESQQMPSAFGRPPSRAGGFDETASAAFGKRAPREQHEDRRPHAVLPKRVNDMSSIMEHFLGPSEPSREYSNSALSQRPKPAPKSSEPEWPELAPARTTSATVKPAMSFVDMMRKRVAADEAEAAAKAQEEALEASRRRQRILESSHSSDTFFAPRYATRPKRSTLYDTDGEIIESDLDNVAGDDTAGVLPSDDGQYDQEDDEDEAAQDDNDDYWRR